MHVSDLKKDRVEVKAQDGNITISGQVNRTEPGMSVSSTFQRSFPAPENVDVSHMEMSQHQDKIIIKFPKILPDAGGA